MTQTKTTPEEIANKIVRLPSDLHTSGNVTMFDLVSGTGYFDEYEKVNKEVIRKRLTSAPDLVDDWLTYSEDKRVKTGWYFRAVADQEYEVGYIGTTEAQYTSILFDDRLEACVEFIKKELEEIRLDASGACVPR